MQRAEWFFARPWRLVLVVALLVALPILWLGEVSATDARARIRSAELDGLANAAVRAAANVNDRIQTIADQVEQGSATPVSGKPTPLLLALQSGDRAALDAFASYLAGLLSPQVIRITVLSAEGRIVASAPDVRGPRGDKDLQDVFTSLASRSSSSYVSGVYLTQGGGGSANLAGDSTTPVIDVASLVRDVHGGRAGAVVADVDLRLLGGALTPLLGAADDLYVIDERGALLIRASHSFTPDSAFLRDLSGSATTVAALGGASRIEGDDPLSGGARLIGSAPVSVSGWHVLAMRSAVALEAEFEGSLAQARVARIALALVLLLGSGVFASTAGRTLAQRRALRESLEQNVRLVNETKESLERETASGAVLRSIADTRDDVAPVLQTIVDEALRICQADGSLYWGVEGDEAVLKAMAGRATEADQIGDRYPIGTGWLIGLAVAERRTYHTADMSSDETRVLVGSTDTPDQWAAQDHDRQGLSRLAVPVLFQGEPIGVIRVQRRLAGGFTPQQIALVESFAAQAAIAIRNVRLFKDTKEALERQTATAEILKAISTSTSDVQPVFDALVERAARLCDADMSTVNLRVDADHYSLAAAWNLPHEGSSLPHQLMPIDRGTASGRVYLEGRTMHWDDFLEDPELSEGARSRSVGQGVRSLLCVPIKKDGQTIGTILLRRSTVKPFAPRQIELVETFADQAAIAIENVRLFNETREKSGQLEVANQELAAASRNKSEFLANMSHELRTPLNAVIGFSDVLEQRMFGELSDRQSEYVRDIASSGRHLLDLVNEILDLSKVEAGRMELESSEFAIADTIHGALGFVRERAAGHRIGLDATLPADLGTVLADERKIRQVLLNLLSNAVKFTPDGGRVAVRALRADGEMQVSVQDTGIGIAPEDQPRVFEEFRQVGKASDRSREGTGLGLTLAKRFIELHGGRIWIDSEVGKGTTFTFAMPVGRAEPVPT